jgi:DNA-binding transcriptional ArsR family regulator
MVEYTLNLDTVFASLADETRRNILGLVARQEMTVSQIATRFKLTYGAISKHILVLEHAKLVIKRRRGKEQLVQLAPRALTEATEYLQWYQDFIGDQYEALENYLSKEA